MLFTQNYNPLGSAFFSTLLAALPVVLLLGLLATGRVSAARAALVGLLTAMGVAIFVFVPVEAQTSGPAGRWEWAQTVGTATLYGAAFGLLPIGWIILNAIFLYSLTVETGQFEVVKRSVLSLSSDRRIQALLIAFCFGAFIEGAAGFGTPVAISAALMMGAGFKPLHAAGLALLANTSPVAFGALGTPITTLAKVTGLDEMKLSAMAGRQLPFFSVLVPAWLVWVMAGWRGVLGVWPALVVCGGSFAAFQFVLANYEGPRLVDVVAGLASMLCLALFLRVWKPREIWTFADEQTPPTQAPSPSTNPTEGPLARGAVIYAWLPWAFLTVFVFAWGVMQKAEVMKIASLTQPVPGLHKKVQRGEAVMPPEKDETPEQKAARLEKAKEAATYNFNLLEATGTGIFFAAVVSACVLRVSVGKFFRIYANALYRLRWPLFTIACMLALAFTTKHSGVDATLGLAFTRTGWLYPMFAALLGWLGVALTGSDTSSNALFGSLQTITGGNLAREGVLPLSVDQAQVLMASANSTGGVMGKMIDAQSIVVSAAATGQYGQEGAILRYVFWHSLILAILMGGLIMIQAYLWTSVIP